MLNGADSNPGQKDADATAHRLAAIVEDSNDAIVAKDLNGIVTDWNAAAERIFGYTADEMIGQSITRIIPPDRVHEEDDILKRIRDGKRIEHFETVRQTKDKKLIDVSVTLSPIRNDAGDIVGASKIARDVTIVKAHEREVLRMSRLYDALSQVNQAIVHAANQQELFSKICEVLVERGGFHMAWIGCHDPASHALIPVAAYGDGFGYTKQLKVMVDDSPHGHGPSGISFKTGRPYICNDLASDESSRPWRDRINRAGYQASAAFPIRRRGAVIGTLNVYTDQQAFFGDKEISLLDEAAGDISFALDNFAGEAERRNAEQAARREAKFTSTIIESMPGIVFFCDGHQHLLRWNKNLEAISGHPGKDLGHMRPVDFFASDHEPSLEEAFIKALEQGNASIEADLLARDGTQTPFMLTASQVVYNGSPSLVCMGFDISARKHVEEALRDLNASLEDQVAMRTRELQSVLDRAMAADEVKSVFLATMSHELRTPLNSIIGFTGILVQGLAGGLNPEQTKQLRMVQDSAHHLLALINDVLDISKIEAGQLEVRLGSFDLRDLLVRVTASLKPMADRKGLELAVDMSPDIGDIESDRRRVEQILINLMNNAIKFTDHGSVRLSAEIVDDHRPLPDADPVRAARLRVSDTGIGIDADSIDTLFEPFRQLDAGLARQHEGTGLGLAICRRLADMLNGEISVESKLGEGSAFTLILPMECVARP